MTGAPDRLVVDGAHGEGGGQIVRTALALAAITGRAMRIENVRAGRPHPGLAAQHLTAVRAAAALCRAEVEGAELGAVAFSFTPRGAVEAGAFAFDVGAARPGGSAGAATLVLQTALLPLALAAGESRLVVRGGTHMAWSPPFDYVRHVWLPALARLGITAEAELVASGWFPVGGGEIAARVAGLGPRPGARLRPLELVERGALIEISGRALAANLPAHVAQRMADRALAMLRGEGAAVRVEPLRLRAACAGAGLFLTARYESVACGFNAIGERGKSAEQVAEEAVLRLLVHRDSGAALDLHLADQIVAPLALAGGVSRFTVERITGHLRTNAWVVERFGLARVGLEAGERGTGVVTVEPACPPAK